MNILPDRVFGTKKKSRNRRHIALMLVSLLFASCSIMHQPCTEVEYPRSASAERDDLQHIVNPFDSDCYDWRGKRIPCDFKRPYTELLLNKPSHGSRFTDNENGTVTDNLTKLVWLKNMNCFGMRDWQNAVLAIKNLKEGDCGPNPLHVLSDGSSAGDWRLPTMKELCTLIDFSRREPALPPGHLFGDIPSGYHWSSTTFDYNPELAWIVYFESGTTCYEGVRNRAGYILPVRKLKE